MKTTYLVKDNRPDGQQALIEISGSEWYEITKQNIALPKSRRRCFIRDIIYDGPDCDTIVIEVTLPEYKKWKSEHQAEWRRRKLEGDVSVLSLDMPCKEDDSLALMDTIMGDCGTEAAYFSENLLNDLRAAAAAWKSWAPELLELYLSGQRRACTPWLANKCGVSEQMARRYKRDFEEFIKEFLT